jgi:hypothetical protein
MADDVGCHAESIDFSADGFAGFSVGDKKISVAPGMFRRFAIPHRQGFCADAEGKNEGEHSRQKGKRKGSFHGFSPLKIIYFSHIVR